MPAIRVEYAKSGRAKCALKECSKLIAKGEVRIGTGAMMPGVDELSYKWRHLCCFTARQLVSVPSVDNIEGFEDLADEDQALIHRVIKGELVGKTEFLGRIAPSQAAAAAPAKKPKGKKGAVTPAAESPAVESPTTGSLAVGEKRKAEVLEDEVDSDGTEDFDDLVVAEAGKAKRTPCPFAEKCYRKGNPEHVTTHSHPGDADYIAGGAAVAPSGPAPPARVADASSAVPAATTSPSKPVQKTILEMWGKKPPPAPTAPEPVPEPAREVKRDAATGKPICPYGQMCFRTAKDHFSEMVHA